MKNELSEIGKDVPYAIDNSIVMEEANSVIAIYDGIYSLRNDDEEIEMYGKITYEWLANSGTYFYGSPDINNENLQQKFENNINYSVFINGLEFGQGFIINFRYRDDDEIIIKGVISQYAILGDKSIPVKKVKFSIPNLRMFIGQPVKRTIEGFTSLSMDRLVFDDDMYTIIIDKEVDYKNRIKKLDEKGGFLILYTGELVTKNQHVTYSDSKDLFQCLNTFLTFMNGKRTSAIFIQGIHEEEIIWTDYADYYIDAHKNVASWSKEVITYDLNALWKKFRLLWGKEDDKNFLTSLIHWYIEANGQMGFSEGSIILAQTALELIYNWWIVEQKKMILGKDSENISASNKIRILISQLNIPSEIPLSFSALTKFNETTDNVIDAPETIVYIRNAIVHSQQEKRKKLGTIDFQARYEALQVCIWYIELALLCILDYEGEYINRCSKGMYANEREQKVPWKK